MRPRLSLALMFVACSGMQVAPGVLGHWDGPSVNDVLATVEDAAGLASGVSPPPVSAPPIPTAAPATSVPAPPQAEPVPFPGVAAPTAPAAPAQSGRPLRLPGDDECDASPPPASALVTRAGNHLTPGPKMGLCSGSPAPASASPAERGAFVAPGFLAGIPPRPAHSSVADSALEAGSNSPLSSHAELADGSWPGLGSAAAAPASAVPADPAPWLLAVGLALALLPWTLYRRIAREEVLDNPTRRAVFGSVVGSPGITCRGAARATGVDRTTASHHLRLLREFGLVEARAFGARARYFKNGGEYDETEKRVHVALASEKARRIVAHLVRHPGTGLTEAARATGIPKTTVQSQLRRLVELGLLESGALRPQAVDAVLRALDRDVSAALA